MLDFSCAVFVLKVNKKSDSAFFHCTLAAVYAEDKTISLLRCSLVPILHILSKEFSSSYIIINTTVLKAAENQPWWFSQVCHRLSAGETLVHSLTANSNFQATPPAPSPLRLDSHVLHPPLLWLVFKYSHDWSCGVLQMSDEGGWLSVFLISVSSALTPSSHHLSSLLSLFVLPSPLSSLLSHISNTCQTSSS